MQYNADIRSDEWPSVPPATFQDASAGSSAFPDAGQNSMDIGADASIPMFEYGDWTHFASMITSGLGNLDGFYQDGAYIF